MAELLIFSERDDLAFELVSKGKEFSSALNMKLCAAVLGGKAEANVSEYFAYGAQKVYLAENPTLADFNTESFAEALYQIGKQNEAKILLIPSTKRGKELGPRVAQKFGAGCITDATGVELKDGNLTVSRYSLGGNAVAAQMIKTPLQVVTIMPKTFELGTKESKQGEIVKVNVDLKAPRTRIVERQQKAGEKVNLEDA